MRRLIRAPDGVIRFDGNRLVRRLLDEAQARGFGLNELAALDFSQVEWEEFYQAIGYSLCGYHELSNVSDASAFKATAHAQKKFPDAEGCRDRGCEVHSGVATEVPG